jgi:hypothetical protein
MVGEENNLQTTIFKSLGHSKGKEDGRPKLGRNNHSKFKVYPK